MSHGHSSLENAMPCANWRCRVRWWVCSIHWGRREGGFFMCRTPDFRNLVVLIWAPPHMQKNVIFKYLGQSHPPSHVRGIEAQMGGTHCIQFLFLREDAASLAGCLSSKCIPAGPPDHGPVQCGPECLQPRPDPEPAQHPDH